MDSFNKSPNVIKFKTKNEIYGHAQMPLLYLKTYHNLIHINFNFDWF